MLRRKTFCSVTINFYYPKHESDELFNFKVVRNQNKKLFTIFYSLFSTVFISLN